MQIYFAPAGFDFEPYGEGIRFLADIDNWCASGLYKNYRIKNISKLPPEQFFEEIAFSSLREQYPHKAWDKIPVLPQPNPTPPYTAGLPYGEGSDSLKYLAFWIVGFNALFVLGFLAFFTIRKRKTTEAS